jgi:hypothetical protein
MADNPKNNVDRDDNPDDEYPTDDHIFIMASPHVKFLKDCVNLVTTSYDYAHLIEPDNIKKFRSAKDYATNGGKQYITTRNGSDDADKVQAAWDEFVQRLKERTGPNNKWRESLLKAVDDGPSSAPELTEDHYWKNGWGTHRDDIIKNVGKFYIPINVKGHFRLKHDDPEGETEFMEKKDFLNISESQRTTLTVESTSGTRNKDITIGQMFTAHNKDRPYYMGLTFNPDPKWNNPNIYNQWQGWPIKPVKGEVQIFLDYANEVSFNRDDSNLQWGMSWAAQIFQQPHILIGTAMVHRGEEGIGKSFFAETLGMLMGKHYVKITDLDQIFGSFNAHIEYALLTHFEEAFWAGDRRAEGRFKDHISGTTRLINQKNLPMRQCKIYPRSLLTTNARWAVPAGPVARRFGVFDVSEAHQRDVEYFGRLDAWRKNGGLEALLYHLLNDIDITKVDLRNPPRTLALMDNQIATLRGAKRFWFDVLRSARLPYFEDKDGNHHVLRDELYTYWLVWCRTVNHKNTLSPETFGSQFKELIPALDVNGRVQRRPNGSIVSLVEGGRQSTGDRDYFHKIPTLALCRGLWDNIWDAQYNWGDTKEWEKLNIEEWLRKKKSIMDANNPF